MKLGFGMGLVLLVALAACATPQPGAAGDAAGPLAGTAWRLTELNGSAPVGGDPLTLEFAGGAEPRASGNGGCNQFGGPYTQDGGSLRFGPLVSTRRACVDEAATRQETAYLQALQSTTRFTRDGGTLVLYAGDRAVARFQAG